MQILKQIATYVALASVCIALVAIAVMTNPPDPKGYFHDREAVVAARIIEQPIPTREHLPTECGRVEPGWYVDSEDGIALPIVEFTKAGGYGSIRFPRTEKLDTGLYEVTYRRNIKTQRYEALVYKKVNVCWTSSPPQKVDPPLPFDVRLVVRADSSS